MSGAEYSGFFVAKSIASESEDLNVPPRDQGLTSLHYSENGSSDYTFHIEPWHEFQSKPYSANYDTGELGEPTHAVRIVDHDGRSNKLVALESDDSRDLENEIRDLMAQRASINL